METHNEVRKCPPHTSSVFIMKTWTSRYTNGMVYIFVDIEVALFPRNIVVFIMAYYVH